MSEDSFAVFCTQEQLKRQNWYSSTYSAKVAIGDHTPDNMDITRIQLPFEPDREIVMQQMFGISNAELKEFYDWFWLLVKNHVQKSRYFAKHQAASVIRLLSAKVVNKDSGGKIIYLLTEPCEPALPAILSEETNLDTIMNLLIRMGIILKDISQEPHYIHHRGITAESFYLRADGKIGIGDFYFAYQDGVDEREIPYTFFEPQSAALWPTVPASEEPKQDINACCSIIWNILNEHYIGETPYYRTIPRKAPEGLVQFLKENLDPNSSNLADFRRNASKYLREIRVSKENELKFKCFIEPSYKIHAVPTEREPLTAEAIADILAGASEVPFSEEGKT